MPGRCTNDETSKILHEVGMGLGTLIFKTLPDYLRLYLNFGELLIETVPSNSSK